MTEHPERLYLPNQGPQIATATPCHDGQHTVYVRRDIAAAHIAEIKQQNRLLAEDLAELQGDQDHPNSTTLGKAVGLVERVFQRMKADGIGHDQKSLWPHLAKELEEQMRAAREADAALKQQDGA